MAIHYPPIFINKYLSEKVAERFYQDGRIDSIESFNFPFFPTSPTDINALTESFPDAANNVFAVYDRMFRMSRRTFPHIKSEQLLYYFYKVAGDPVALIETTQIVQDLLDNADESAQDINDWVRGQINGGVVTFDDVDFLPVYFHDMKVYQLEEVRDIVDFGTARTYAGNKMIIDYDWHKGE